VIEPAAFQKILTDRAAAPELTYHMLSAAIDAHKEWRNQNAPDIRFAVNLTVHDLSDVQFVDDLDWRIREAGLNWADFTFEVTESVVMGNPDGSVYSSMERIREKGGEVSLDDFGTGFAGLAHLRDWPIDSVKIDREFVKGMTCNPKDDMIVASIISLAHRLDLEVIAEGIETEEVARRLTQMGCDRGQGYHFSRPVDRENAFSILCENRLERDAGRAPYFAER
jgi:EAL domain-containing protein (putative c-di-GMP-specific phosphodiesterase class I)